MEKKPDNKYSKVFETVKSRILSGYYAPGERLAGQNVLACEFGVSPITTKRALNDLQEQGFIERRSRSGSFVAEKPRILSEVNIVIGGQVENEKAWLSDYWRGIEAGASTLNIPCQLLRTSNPAFEQKVLDGPATQGVILLGFEDIEIIDKLNERNIPFVVGEKEAKHADYNVHVNRRRITAELTEVMVASGADRIDFIGSMDQPNHRLVADGLLVTVRDKNLPEPRIIDAEDSNIIAAVETLLQSDSAPSALIVAGGGLPFKALPTILRLKPDIMLGVLTENPTVMQLQGTAFIGAFDQFQAGELTFELLYQVASGKITCATTNYPSFEIIKP